MVLVCKIHEAQLRIGAALLSTLLLSACALPTDDHAHHSPPLQLGSPAASALWHERLNQLQTASVILLGEQHDAPQHHAWEADTVRELAARQRLAALVLEMADAGTSTANLPASASEADVQSALQWNEKGWPWTSYGPSVMHAVRAGVPVLGGNLPRAQMGNVMKNPVLDGHLATDALQIQMNAIKEGHCNLLPESQWLPMTRIQLARDESMGKVLQSAVRPNLTVLLIAGHGHVRTDVGVPQWLPRNLTVRTIIAQAGKINPDIVKQADFFVITPELPAKDHCAGLREQFKR